MASRSYSNNSRDEPEGSESNQPSKVRRTLRACLQCRLRKQKCAGASRDSPSRPCPRCVHLGMSCSFESTPTEEQRTSPIAKTARRVEVLQRDFADHERRIRQIELLLDDYGKNVVEPPSNPSGACSNAPPSQQKRQDTSAPSRTAGSEANATTEGSGCDTLQAPPDLSNAVALDADADTDAGADAGVLAAVNLDTPMTTLRHLRHLRPSTADRGAKAAAIADPISCGILTLAEAQAAFDVLFQRCHRWGPVLCPRTQRSVEAVRTSNPTLFLSVCTVGCRFMPEISLPTYHRLVALLDSALSRLLLRPTPEDVHLDHICALLLYVQWMPCDDGGIHSASRDSSSEAGHSQKERMFVTRYNDVSTWSMLGLAIRYALLLGLHSDAVVPFLASPKGDQHPQYPQHALHTPSRPTQQRANGLHGAPVQPSSVINVSDVSRLRVWINLLTCDANLMLSSGLPASLNPEPVADIARTFAAHRVAAQPDDTRAAALCELVVILKRAAKSSGRPNVRALDAVSLRKANADLDAWEQSWLCTLGEDIQRSQMPFTTLRAYRLAINSSCLSSLLSSSPRPPAPATLHELYALDVSLTAATQTILALSAQTQWQQTRPAREPFPFPDGPLTPDDVAVACISYSVDSSWITHSFAIIFVVLCYYRRAVNDELAILALPCPADGQYGSVNESRVFPAPPRPESKLLRLVSLASMIFRRIHDSMPPRHPASAYRRLLDNVFDVLSERSHSYIPRSSQQESRRRPRSASSASSASHTLAQVANAARTTRTGIFLPAEVEAQDPNLFTSRPSRLSNQTAHLGQGLEEDFEHILDALFHQPDLNWPTNWN